MHLLATHSSKRARRPEFRLALVFTDLPLPPFGPGPPPPLPPKSPQFSETEVRSDSIPGGDTTCSQTSPRSSLIDEIRPPYGSSAREFAITPDGQDVVYLADQDQNDVIELYASPLDP